MPCCSHAAMQAVQPAAGTSSLAAILTALHDKAKHAIAGTPHGQATEQLVAHRLSLGHSAQSAVGDLQVKVIAPRRAWIGMGE